MAREDWNILVTHIPVEKCSADELVWFYRQRWGIEIHFRAWKQSLHMHKVRFTGSPTEPIFMR